MADVAAADVVATRPMSSRWRHPGRSGAAVYALAAAIVSAVLALFSRVQVERQRGRRSVAKHLPPGRLIVISNHTSYADGLLLALVCRRMGRSLRMLATSGVFKAPVIGSLARKLGFIPVARGTSTASDSLDLAAEALEHGEAIGLFPEGRLTRNPEKWPERAKTGAVRLAIRTDTPIVPVAMEGAHKVVREKRLFGNLIANVVRRPKVSTRIGASINVRALIHLAEGAEPTQHQIRQAADKVQERLIDLVEELRGEIAPDPFGVIRVPD
jgi:1-acyl-sn-glycerol-3-phosphate acyltransferase